MIVRIPFSVRAAVGDYDVEIPEDTPAGLYKIRVGSFSEPEVYDCSGEFEIEMDGDMSMSYRL